MKTLLRLAAVAIALGLAAPALAQTATANITVTATVINSCGITSAALAFGNYDPIDIAPRDAEATLNVTCTSGAPWWIGLSAGGHAGSGASGARAMANGTDYLGYDLYRAATRSSTELWGDVAAPGSSPTTATGLSQSVTVYGRIPAGQTRVPAGAYTDTVTATVNL